MAPLDCCRGRKSAMGVMNVKPVTSSVKVTLNGYASI
jgi:hypothetical protein